MSSSTAPSEENGDGATFFFEEVSIGESEDPMAYDEVSEITESGDFDDEDDIAELLASVKRLPTPTSMASAPGTPGDGVAKVGELEETPGGELSPSPSPSSPGDDRFPAAQQQQQPVQQRRPAQGRKKKELQAPLAASTVTQRPEVVDDFIRNFLLKLGMSKTFEMFQTEWYALQAAGKLNAEDVGVVPDIYVRNEQLDEQVKLLRKDVLKARAVAERARGTWDKFRKERDFHRMHHRRVVQEKNRLVTDLKRLQKHYSALKPTVTEVRAKYENAMKDKMLMRLEKERALVQVKALEEQLKQWQASTMGGMGGANSEFADEGVEMKRKEGESGGADLDKTAASTASGTGKKKKKKTGKFAADTPWPPDDRVNPDLDVQHDPVDAEKARLSKTFKGHSMAISAMALHPSKPILATVSDDMTWKMWSLPKGDLIMTGDGHRDWVAAVEFHPRGTLLATASGDKTVKIWDFLNARCAHTFTDHSQCVWGATFHDGGDFLATASMDHTARLFDLNSMRCRQTFRGHVDSVNGVRFQPYSNNLCTVSGDKTVSLWDIRSGLCSSTFFGHNNAVLDANFNRSGYEIVSSDSDGVVKVWDVRMVGERCAFSASAGQRHPVNSVTFDRSGKQVFAAVDSGVVAVWNVAGDKPEAVIDLAGHEDSVQAVLLDPRGKFLVTAGSDATFRVWDT